MPAAFARDADPDNRHGDYHVSVARSRIAVPNERDRPASLVSTSSYTPQIVATARDRQQSGATEVLPLTHNPVSTSSEGSVVERRGIGRLSGV